MKYAKDSLAVRVDGHGLLTMTRGDAFPADHWAVVARPELFTDTDPGPAGVSVAGRPKPWLDVEFSDGESDA